MSGFRCRMFTRLAECGGFTRPAESVGGQDKEIIEDRQQWAMGE